MSEIGGKGVHLLKVLKCWADAPRRSLKVLETGSELWAAFERWVQLRTKPAEKLCFGPAKWSPLSVCVCVCIRACVCLTVPSPPSPWHCDDVMVWVHSTQPEGCLSRPCFDLCDVYMKLSWCPLGFEPCRQSVPSLSAVAIKTASKLSSYRRSFAVPASETSPSIL